MNTKEIPVLLLTGYLGSGKTTLVNRILTNKRGVKFAVIVNDIGEVNIDADLIEKGGIVDQKDDSLVALQNGCICCTLKMDLVEQLCDIMRMKRFDYIVIEASGVCEPAPIAQTICSIPTMGPKYIKDGIARLDNIVTVVDALRMKDEFAMGNDLMQKNIDEEDIVNLISNMIVLNTAAEVEPHELQRIKHIIRALQPKADILECNYGEVDLDQLINTHRFNFDEVATSAAWIDAIEHHHDDEEEEEEHHHHHEHEHEDDHEHDDKEHEHHHHEHEHHHHHHHHDGGEVEEYGIGTFVYYRRKPFDLVYFDRFIAEHWPHEVIRCKGICWFKDEPQTCYVFEQAGKQMGLRNAGQWYATMPEKELKPLLAANEGLQKDWNETYGDRMQKLVFIGQHLDREKITAYLDEILVD